MWLDDRYVKPKASSGSLESFPSETLLNIFTRVPAESVLECKLVCKSWRTLIHHGGTYFTNMHFSRQLKQLYGGDNNIATSKVEPSLFFVCRSGGLGGLTSLYQGGQITDKISINEKYSYKENLKKINHIPMDNDLFDHLVASCNGLICVFIRHHLVADPIYIFNPITGEYVYLPELLVKPSHNMLTYPFNKEKGGIGLFSCVACGFGYASSTDEYKIVRINYPRTRGHVEVYTLGSGCGWRRKGKIRFQLMERNGPGIFANGAIYWTANNNVVAFDLDDEKFQLLPYPPCMINYDLGNYDTYGLVALGGRVCFFLDKLRLEIWSLKTRESENSDPQGIWCLDFDIGLEGVEVDREWKWFKPILLTENEKVVLIYDECALYCYDSKTKTLKMISDEDEVSIGYFASVKAIPHVNTFASLEAIGEKSKRDI